MEISMEINMINEELEVHLENIIVNLQEMTDILNRSSYHRESVGDTRFYKGVEDGILDNMINADEKQFNTIMTAYKFRYYREFNTDKELLRSEVTRRIREKKLNRLIV
jgi:hypothetical protein